ncbi:hypothetical protein TCAL_06464 [Tigriopus californicus]|uniref:furin n=1 Tax=Tigriopus californicus TaxID=6832 RepID=A0A553PJU0_TIGCA|nr:furin-like protease kpc-1 [Tigriopus californicus]TRY77950.1 hypothetical protein TCAL_06464 [Tigriopus californicus]|eukprot:TCALIF_06464-PA protein Name:"Similar to Fur1 Furin-like protease 1, isoform 1-CRR (Drosophila melanogaster)" AED:0.04 eAED:0.04 QI:412/1/1/1/1/1/4/107/751
MNQCLWVLLVLVVYHPCINSKEWAICVDQEGTQTIEHLAVEHKVEVLGEIIPESGCYHVKTSSTKRSKRSPRGNVIQEETDESDILRGIEHSYFLEEQLPKIRTKRLEYHDFGISHKGQAFTRYGLNDPYWGNMWYLNRDNELTMNVEQAWQEGITGRGVTVTILDDGIEKDHPDLIRNYDPLSSTDINDNDSDPNPRYDLSNSNRHGTRCAGQVAASPNNSMCAVGVAFNAQIGGIRMLDGQVSDAVEARSLSFNPDHVSIYSSSWGPNDDGKTVDGPGKLAFRAFKNGITRGRNGKGSIFVWASGNGGRYKDNCNCDGYATSIYTITVSSTSESGQIPWYSEACSSTLATTYSSGTSSERQIVTTDLHHGCTTKHTGTSASAPMAAGIIALALEANPLLTWRDVQHIIVLTSRPLNLKAPDWKKNALGRSVSHSYGYGLMDASAMVKWAREWKLMPKQEECLVSSPYYYKIIPAMGYITIELEVHDCPGIKYLEHVVSPVHVTPGRKRGDLRIYLQSPQGTRSTLLDARPQDFSSSAFIDWPFMTVHTWGENPVGKWILEIHNDAYSKWASDAKFFKWSLELFGTETDPNQDDTNAHHGLDKEEEKEDKKFNVVREAVRDPSEFLPPIELDSEVILKNNSSKSGLIESQTNKLSLGIPDKLNLEDVQDRGCVSKQLECTKNIEECRTFTYRSVAGVFCTCIGMCLEVAAGGLDTFNMQCLFTRDEDPPSSPFKDIPMYCQFIPFLRPAL